MSCLIKQETFPTFDVFSILQYMSRSLRHMIFDERLFSWYTLHHTAKAKLPNAHSGSGPVLGRCWQKHRPST